MSDEPPNRVDAQLKWLGVLVMAVGGIMALLFGLCTFYAGAMFVGPGAVRDPMALAIPLIVGGLPTLTGIAIFGVGAWMVARGGKKG